MREEASELKAEAAVVRREQAEAEASRRAAVGQRKAADTHRRLVRPPCVLAAPVSRFVNAACALPEPGWSDLFQ